MKFSYGRRSLCKINYSTKMTTIIYANGIPIMPLKMKVNIYFVE